MYNGKNWWKILAAIYDCRLLATSPNQILYVCLDHVFDISLSPYSFYAVFFALLTSSAKKKRRRYTTDLGTSPFFLSLLSQHSKNGITKKISFSFVCFIVLVCCLSNAHYFFIAMDCGSAVCSNSQIKRITAATLCLRWLLLCGICVLFFYIYIGRKKFYLAQLRISQVQQISYCQKYTESE